MTICGWQAVGRHDVAADVEVEQLIGAAQFDVGLQEHGVVRLASGYRNSCSAIGWPASYR